ncbi:hypothetical protein ACFVW2_11320 [Streptomyces sp. NPDC058171]
MRLGKMGIAFGTAAACVAGLFVFSPAAGAAEGSNEGGRQFAPHCKVTLYATAGYRDGKRDFQGEDKTFSGDRWDNGKLMNDDANSAKSTCDQFVTIYEDSYARGQMTFLDYKENVTDLSRAPHNMGNKASSLYM